MRRTQRMTAAPACPHAGPRPNRAGVSSRRTTGLRTARLGSVTRATVPTAFTLVELLITVAVIALLLSILLPSFGRAREQARAAVCSSNIRQLALANSEYAGDNGRYCPAAAGIRLDNLQRWHGVRDDVGQPFDPTRGPLASYLGADARIRACPAFTESVQLRDAAFERGCGGYGYNQAYLGRILEPRRNGSFRVVTDLYGVMSETVHRPGDTLMFADTALAASADGVIEYSFAEPRFHPEYLATHGRPDPSLHFRHHRAATVAWTDGHVDRRPLAFTWSSGIYLGNPASENVGWFGQTDDNGFFDLE